MPRTVLLLLLAASPLRADDRFEREIRPLLLEHCVSCHGPDKQKGNLRLDTKAGWQTGGDAGPAIKPGKPKESLLIRAIGYTDPDLRMPPKAKLTDREIESLTKWVQDGADDPRDGGPRRIGGTTLDEAKKWWAFQPVRRPPIPKIDASTPVDAFLLAELRKKGLSLSPPADRRTLIRRATYDLIGMPPTVEEIEAFVNDASPNAFERVIDRLLASPHYGERWGRHWLDLVRYADTAGENSDHPLPHMWRYRNWVIDSFNRDQPYDHFLRDQICGDLLPNRGPDRIVATGFLALARRFDHDSDKSMHLTREDGIDTLGKSLLGLTLGCARCHDHKYDAVTARDYYALYGIFESTKFSFAGCEAKQQPRDLIPLAPQSSEVAFAVTEGQPADSRLHLRGDPEKLGEVVPRRWLELFGSMPISSPSGSGRLDLANWIAGPSNPLTARVMVNRLWLHHIGKGLVKTPNDFGTRGSPPSHPDLLDWLASEFVASGWSVKAMHRSIMLSSAYQQSVFSRPEAMNADPNNDLVWRFDRRRLSAEELRDSLLFASGQLDRTPAKAHPFPPEASWNYTQHVPFGTFFETDKRSVYLVNVRNRRHPFLALFDGADPNATTPQRQSTTVPTQALYFLNDPFFHQQAERVAAKILARPESNRVGELFRVALQRSPTDREIDFARSFLRRYADSLTDVPEANRLLPSWSALTRVLLAGNEFLFVE